MHTLLATPDHDTVTGATRPDPRPGPGEILLEVIAAAVNPVDTFVASGTAHEVFGLEGEVGLGWDVTGRVVAVGAGVEAPTVGDVIAALHDQLAAPSRTHADLVVVPAAAAAVVPDGLDPVEAASIPLNVLTAAQALDLLGDPAGRTLLVTGAAGAVGGYAVALATALGWQVSGLARPTDEAFVAGLGAEHLDDAAGRTWDAVLDPAVLREGILAMVGDGGDYVGVQPAMPLEADRGVRVQQVMVHADGARLAELLSRSVSGELAVRVAGTTPLADAGAAYAKVAGGGQRGRWLLLP